MYGGTRSDVTVCLTLHCYQDPISTGQRVSLPVPAIASSLHMTSSLFFASALLASAAVLTLVG